MKCVHILYSYQFHIKISLNEILNVQPEIRVLKKIGYGARSAVYEVELDGNRSAMKYLVSSNEANRTLIDREYRMLNTLRNCSIT